MHSPFDTLGQDIFISTAFMLLLFCSFCEQFKLRDTASCYACNTYRSGMFFSEDSHFSFMNLSIPTFARPIELIIPLSTSQHLGGGFPSLGFSETDFRITAPQSSEGQNHHIQCRSRMFRWLILQGF